MGGLEAGWSFTGAKRPLALVSSQCLLSTYQAPGTSLSAGKASGLTDWPMTPAAAQRWKRQADHV